MPFDRQHRSHWSRRAVDVVGASIGLVVASPVLVVVGVLVRWRLGRPVVFRQPRPGLHGEVFTLHKFRTMRDDRDADGTLRPDAERLTRLGRVLRATSLDELPELWNVLRGDMSLVGPRPLLTDYLERYSPEQARRHEVRPGITGLAQVMGRNTLGWDERLALDVRYVDEQSWRLDLRIAARTVAQVLRIGETHAAGHATAPEFLGRAAPEARHAAGRATAPEARHAAGRATAPEARHDRAPERISS